MTQLLTEAFKLSQSLPDHLQDELAKQWIDDIENELQWQRPLSQEELSLLDSLAGKVLQDSAQGKNEPKSGLI
jgi:hypothetical protein